MDKLKDKLKTAAIVLASTAEGKGRRWRPGLPPTLTGKAKAASWSNHVAQQVGGKGGGRPTWRRPAVPDAAKFPSALSSVAAWVE